MGKGRIKQGARWLLAAALLPAVLAAAPQLPDHLRDGLVVWESNRTGAWRIFARELTGGPSRQLSPDESGRNHFAVHIAPDGQRIVYLSYPHGMNGYRKQEADVVIPLLIQSVAPGAEPRVLIPNARPYGEHRCAVWIDDKTLIYLDKDYYPHRLDLASGRSTRLLHDRPSGRRWDLGYLIDPTLRYATSGDPGFFLYDKDAQTVSPRRKLGGCQPYFTPDGEWGYWMAGMGGPINRYHLATEATGTILAKHDPRMPEGRAYLYFPFISPCRQAIVFAASPDEHSHDSSDYDLFIAPLDSATIEVNGPPVRITTDRATDRFPELHIRPLQLGRWEGKAPLAVRFAPDPPDGWTWQINDRTATGPGAFVFRNPGTYRVEAHRDGVRKRGLVLVAPASPPALIASGLGRDGWIALTFNEPVEVTNATFQIARGGPIQRIRHTEDSPTVRLLPERVPDGPVLLRIEGVRDRAQQPSSIDRLDVRVERITWPVNPDGLLLAWESGDGLRQLYRPGEDTPVMLNLMATGRARLTAHQAMLLDGGAFIADDAAGPLLESLRGGEAITIEAVIQARNTNQRGPARIVSFSTSTATRNFTLGQERDQYVLRLRTPQSGENAVRPGFELGPVNTERPVHLVVTYRSGLMVAYLDGAETARSTALRGDFSNWSPHTVLFGAEADDSRDWGGTLEGVAIYRRFMEADEVAANAAQAQFRLENRTAVPVSVVEGRLVEATPVPSLDEISPYREIMVAHEYEWVRTLEGPAPPARFRVYHWGLLDADRQPLPATQPGDVTRLQLEPFAAHRHLQDIFPADALPLDLDIPVYLDASP